MPAVVAVRSVMPSKPSKPKDIMKDMRRAPTEVLLATAEDIVQQQSQGSTVFDPAVEARIPGFDVQEITLGRVLGRGGFCVVREIEKISTGSDDGSQASRRSKGSFLMRMMRRKPSKRSLGRKSTGDADSSFGGSDFDSTFDVPTNNNNMGAVVDFKYSRDFVARNAKKGRRKTRYVVKRVALELKHEDKIRFLKGTVDLAMEAKFLSVLDHPNIVQLVGVSSCGPFNENSFLVLEKMTETLTRRFKTWMNVSRQCQGVTGIFSGSKCKIEGLHRERLEVAYDIAAGASYLHKKNIIFRDLKPDNVGFDLTGTVKLFDFGLAKALSDCQPNKDGLYHLTGMTGALRYMAPEVCLGKPYNLAADVYSWSMIMWYILSLEPPFGLYSQEMIIDRVLKRGTRPSVFKSWSDSIGNLMKQGWHTDIAERPSFQEISLVLKQELIESDSTVAGSMAGSVSGDSLPGIPEHLQRC